MLINFYTMKNNYNIPKYLSYLFAIFVDIKFNCDNVT